MADTRTINEADERRALLAPFQKILDRWTVEVREEWRSKIVGLKLVASGDLHKDWRILVKADHERGQVVAEFFFSAHGRFFDMRRVQYAKQVPVDAIEEWIKNRLDVGKTFKSALAERLGVSYRDPRVTRDLAWRIAKTKTRLPRRRWYNKTKQASLYDLYPRLQEAMAATVSSGISVELDDTGPRRGRPRTRPI